MGLDLGVKRYLPVGETHVLVLCTPIMDELNAI